MRHVMIAVALVLGASVQAATPEFLLQDDWNCATFAVAINYYVMLGEVRANVEIDGLVDDYEPDSSLNRAYTWPPPVRRKLDDSWRLRNRLSDVCRVLYEQKGVKPLREPGFGWIQRLPFNSMPAELWPLLPVVQSGSTYFLLGDDYALEACRRRSDPTSTTAARTGASEHCPCMHRRVRRPSATLTY